MSSAFRVSQRIATLTAKVSAIRSAPALPSEIKALRIRSTGLKNNAGLRAWTRHSLPAICYASPDVQISVEPPPAAPDADSATPSTSSASPPPHLAQPGVLIEFHDPALPEAFLPFTKARSDVLAKRFWDAVADPVALERLRSAATDAFETVAEEVEQVEALMGLEAAPVPEGAPTKVREGRSMKDLLL